MKRIQQTLLIALAGLGLTSCEKYLDINRDPSTPQIAEGYTLLPPILEQMALGEQYDCRFIGKYIQNWGDVAANDTWDRHGYQSGSDNAGLIWRVNYWNLGPNIQLMIDDANAKQKWEYLGVAHATFAWSWLTTTDYHGEIVLKQAFEPGRYVFDYDSQEDVYAHVNDLCAKSLEAFSRTDGIQGVLNKNAADLVYKGDKSKWVKFVYAVMARAQLHLSNKGTFNADKVIEYCDKSFASNADNFNVPSASSGNSTTLNFLGPTRSNFGSYRQTDWLVKLLDGTILGAKDPRLNILASASPDGVVRGVTPTQGDPNNTKGSRVRIPTLWGVSADSVVTGDPNAGKYVFKDGADFPLITYAEVQFMKAEAAFKKGDKAMAYEAYKKGVQAAMDFAKVPAAAATAYLAGKAVPQTVADLKISDIMTQKYLALYGHGVIETWVDMRRYKYSADVYPGFTPPAVDKLFPDNNGKLAYRVRPRYNSEYVWNRTSLDKVGGNNLDYHTYPTWIINP